LNNCLGPAARRDFPLLAGVGHQFEIRSLENNQPLGDLGAGPPSELC